MAHLGPVLLSFQSRVIIRNLREKFKNQNQKIKQRRRRKHLESGKRERMAEENKAKVPPRYDLNAKWDACLDLGVRRFVYSSFTGALAGLLLFREFFSRYFVSLLSVSFNWCSVWEIHVSA